MELNEKSVTEKQLEKCSNICIFKNTILNIIWFKEVSIKIKIYFELNENTACQNLSCAAKTVFMGNL